MNLWVLAAVVIIVVGIALALWRRISYTIVASVTCVLVYVLQLMTYSDNYMAFVPHDLTEPGNIYTVLTSMYAHHPDYLGHLLFNVLVLVLIGFAFEQRIGTGPFVLLYLLSGLAGTLAFAAYYWNGPSYYVLGASGAISGVLGGFARLYPNERMSFMFFPFVPLRAVYVVLIIVAIQLVFIARPDLGVAWQAHIAGLVVGVLLAPLVVRLAPERRLSVRVSAIALRKLAVTPELRGILRRIESEEVPDVRKAWIGHFMSKAKCPTCGAPVKVAGDAVRCSNGHIL